MNVPEFRPTGTHLIADLHGVGASILSQPQAIDALLRQAAEAAGAHIIYSHCHPFGEGQGVTGVVLLAESHISIHTWPEFSFAAIDIFMCGNAAPQRALEFLQHAFSPRSMSVKDIARGHNGVPG